MQSRSNAVCEMCHLSQQDFSDMHLMYIKCGKLLPMDEISRKIMPVEPWSSTK